MHSLLLALASCQADIAATSQLHGTPRSMSLFCEPFWCGEIRTGLTQEGQSRDHYRANCSSPHRQTPRYQRSHLAEVFLQPMISCQPQTDGFGIKGRGEVLGDLSSVKKLEVNKDCDDLVLLPLLAIKARTLKS
ncbi:hypothetical protein RRG08_048774 [Elysia crispata]|uniref:Secreted protein n=1 Tax=Elysia crispata TaxID=231223 RepID=A0AAE1E2P4_9GAST|nr:hypothetical protein RRG08_048774 [Elysia crispata]